MTWSMTVVYYKVNYLPVGIRIHTSFEESSRAKKSFITFDTDFWRYLPSQSRIGGSLKWSIAKFCSEAKFAGEIG